MSPSQRARVDTATREQLVAEIRDQLTRLGAPRLQLLLIVILSGTAAFLVSAAGLQLGVVSMALRYAMATVAGYLAFVALLRVWIAWQRGSSPDLDLPVEYLDVDIEVPQFDTARDSEFFAGGRSGGAGATVDGAGLDAGATRTKRALPRRERSFDPSLDLNDLWPVLLAVACALAGFLAVVYVVWTAPLLLAEVALDGAVFAAVYRRLHERDAAHWVVTTLRRTWLVAALLVLFAAGCGFAFERIAPGAQSIGGVVRAVMYAR